MSIIRILLVFSAVGWLSPSLAKDETVSTDDCRFHLSGEMQTIMARLKGHQGLDGIMTSESRESLSEEGFNKSQIPHIMWIEFQLERPGLDTPGRLVIRYGTMHDVMDRIEFNFENAKETITKDNVTTSFSMDRLSLRIVERRPVRAIAGQPPSNDALTQELIVNFDREGHAESLSIKSQYQRPAPYKPTIFIRTLNAEKLAFNGKPQKQDDPLLMSNRRRR